MSTDTNTPTVKDLMDAIDAIAPFRLAESWDNVGLQFGHPDRPAGRVLVALEATPEVLEEATEVGANTLVLHHPLIFKPPKSFAETDPVADLAARVIRANLNVIAAHTNWDSVADGTNGEIADRLGLENRSFLVPAKREGDYKFVVFTPRDHIAAVIEAAAGAGAGVIGNYSHCTFRTPGTGTYKPLEGADPYAGTVGEMEQADTEERLEIVVPKARLGALIEAVKAAHPYEEVAFDVYPLEATGEAAHGLGLVGDLPKAMTLMAFTSFCKDAFRIGSVGVVGDLNRELRRVAICSGGGGGLLAEAQASGADVFVTGEMTHHGCAEARVRGLAAILLGHHNSEAIAGGRLARRIREALPGVDVRVSEKEIAPVMRF
ncbi:MAG: Nif3-like dinuclear metal center hexameric protein [Sumerlaeia bacterium]